MGEEVLRGREAERLPCFEPHPFFRLRFERRRCRLRPEGATGNPENAEHCSEQKTAEHSAEAATCADKAGFAGKSCADARRQTKGGELGESRPHERRLAGPLFRGSVLNVARCCALPPVSCPESRGAMRRNLRQAKRFARSAPRCEDHVPRSVRRKMRVVFPSAPCRAATFRRVASNEPGNAVSSEFATACRAFPTPRRNVPDAGPSGLLMRPPRTRSSLTLPRGTNRLMRLVPTSNSRESIRRGTLRRWPLRGFLLPGASSTPDAVSLRVSGPVTPHGLAVQRGPWAPAETGLPRLCGQGCSTRLAKRLSAPIRAAPSPRAEAFRPTDGERKAPGLSQPHEEVAGGRSRWTTRGDFPPLHRSCAASALPPCLGHSSSARTHKTHGASAESSTSTSEGPFQGLAPARLGNTFTPRRHWGTTAPAPRIVKKYSCV